MAIMRSGRRIIPKLRNSKSRRYYAVRKIETGRDIHVIVVTTVEAPQHVRQFMRSL